MPIKISSADIRADLPFGVVADQGLDLVRKAYAAARSERGVAGVPTGLSQLDLHMGGLQVGLHVLAAEPGAGKTALCLNIARHAALKHKLPVLYVSFDEMPARLALKILASSAGLSMSDMAAGKLQPEKVAAAIEQHAPGLASLSFVAGDASLTSEELSQQLSDRLAHHGADIGLLIIDYMQPWAAAMASQGSEFRMAVGKMVSQLRLIANETMCPVLMISAQNREGQGKAELSSLRESSDLEYTADSALFLTKDKDQKVGMGKHASILTIKKNRFGRNDVEIQLVLDGPRQVITERPEHAYTSRGQYD